jgi:hypothetical protein
VFFNDPDSEKAGVIHLDGRVTAVAKYDPSDPRSSLDNDRLAQGNRPEPPPPPADPGAPGDDQATTPPPPDAGGDPGTAAQPPPGAPGPEAPPPPGGGDQQGTPGLPPPDPGPGGSTTSTTPSTSTTSTSTTSTTTTTLPTQPTQPDCGPGDADGDGVNDLCDPDDDNDGVPDESDACQGSNDHNDYDGDGRPDGCDGDWDGDGVPNGSDACPGGNDNNDGDVDGIPDACDDHDDSGPEVSIVSGPTFVRNGNVMRVEFGVSSSDPESGVGTTSATISGTFTCDTGDTFNFGDGWDTRTGGGNLTFGVDVVCGDSNRPPINIHGQIWATAVNTDGVSPIVDPFLNF